MNLCLRPTKFNIERFTKFEANISANLEYWAAVMVLILGVNRSFNKIYMGVNFVWSLD